MLKLVGTDGTRFYSWILEPGRYTIGRKKECDFCVPHKTISRNHARLDVNENGEEIFLTDLDSHNGTTINGSRLIGRKAVREGDRLMFGDTEFRLTLQDKTDSAAGIPARARLSENEPVKSVFLSINEALKPLPTKVTEKPELLPVIFEMAKMLVLPEAREVMLQRSLVMIAKIIPSERLAVLFVSDDQEEVYTAASLLPGGKDPGEFTLSRTIVKEIVSNKNAILISNPLDDPRFAGQKSIIMSELKSALAVPLFDEGKVLGILYADTTRPSQQYDDDHLRVLATFGNIIASRLQSYTLLAERQEMQIMESELRRASTIQKNLLVREPPEITGYQVYSFQEQSRSVGGDLYDLTLLPDGRLLFIVADVSGKGMGAALLMSNILASFRILYESETLDLAQMVRKVSLQMYRYSAPGDFATLFIGLVEPGGHRLRYINAGHNPPLLVKSGGDLSHLEPSGIMIGAFDFAVWQEQIIDLADGDLLFIFSDGVTEAERENVQYGESRMEKLVTENRHQTPREIVERLMGDLNEFMGEAPRSDDITILIVKRAEK
ncbi:MAG: SpoIIE family protein phosphatase [candidate division Zixibacteria bacterium]|nr:SpoIIE family protein phosphatase [candidate division Zixibacteria bacterium]MDD5425186.1 SpoIIE family protein phosphatase [candidate division Zixibacteria bacterium]